MDGKMPYLRAGLVGIGLLLVLTVVPGCAERVPTVPLAEQERLQALAVPDGKALVYFFRIRRGRTQSNIVNFRVSMNGQEIGEISTKQYYIVEVPPGVVTIQSKTGKKSLRLNLDLAVGEQRYVDTGYRVVNYYLVYT